MINLVFFHNLFSSVIYCYKLANFVIIVVNIALCLLLRFIVGNLIQFRSSSYIMFLEILQFYVKYFLLMRQIIVAVSWKLVAVSYSNNRWSIVINYYNNKFCMFSIIDNIYFNNQSFTIFYCWCSMAQYLNISAIVLLYLCIKRRWPLLQYNCASRKFCMFYFCFWRFLRCFSQCYFSSTDYIWLLIKMFPLLYII